jgi:transposase-like protein
MGERAAPFYCPYCGEEDIRPEGEGHGDWRCSSCARLWRLKYLGLSRTALGGTLRVEPAQGPET